MNAHDDPSLIDEGDIDSLGHAHSVDVAAGRKNDRRSRPKRRIFQPPSSAQTSPSGLRNPSDNPASIPCYESSHHHSFSIRTHRKTDFVRQSRNSRPEHRRPR